MKYAIIAVTILAAVLLLNMSYYSDYQTGLTPGVYLKDGEADLRADNWSVPVVTDWDGDGVKDLLVGNRTYDKNKINQGHISFFRNVGTDDAPVFNGSDKLRTCSNQCATISVMAEG